jgi:Ca2+-binding RTX toxin-like protein
VQTVGIALDGAGTHTIVNSGTILVTTADPAAAAILGQDDTFVGIDHITNSGTIFGFIGLGLGDDVFNNFAKVKGKIKDGTVNGTILLGDGNDKFFGGKFVETVGDDAGTDLYKLGGGNDFFGAKSATGPSGDDTVDGGKGTDTYAVFGTNSFSINLDGVQHGSFAPNTATGADIGTDKVFNFENVIASDSPGATIHGSAAANELIAGSGADDLFGYGGNDHLVGGDGTDDLLGGTGNDLIEGGAGADGNLIGEAGDDEVRGGPGADGLIGGLGKDRLFGGSGNDFFRFDNIGQSGVGASKRDVIFDFSQADLDKIFLSFIDADTTTAGDQGFDLIDFQGGFASFTNVAGQLRYIYSGGSTIVEGDVNGDAKADFQIELIGHYVLTDADFIP